MPVLVDTGILVRLLERTDPSHQRVRQAIRLLKGRSEVLVTSPQNAAEFWNVCTRPSTVRGGLGLTVADTDRRLRVIERLIGVLPDSPAAYAIWRQLAPSVGVMGVQVHDARLVAFLTAHGIQEILTLNPADFARYPGITVLTPDGVLGVSP
jgi:predicted nucleic acid-binding protein